jgi:hypothetical protein
MLQHKRTEKNNSIGWWPVAALLLLFFFLAGCGSGETPEDQVKQFVAAGEEAVEAGGIGGVGDVRDLISKKYSDEHNRTRRDLAALSARYILSSKNIHILTRIGELTFPSENKALMQLYVAMTGQNVSDLDALLNMQADLYRFDMELVREDKEWKLLKADWRRAKGEDFF